MNADCARPSSGSTCILGISWTYIWLLQSPSKAEDSSAPMNMERPADDHQEIVPTNLEEGSRKCSPDELVPSGTTHGR